jgi:hypothetical protein
VRPRLDSQQRRILQLLSTTEWRTTDAVFAETSLYRSPQSIGAALGKLNSRGLVERRVISHNPRISAWRLLESSEPTPDDPSAPRLPHTVPQ